MDKRLMSLRELYQAAAAAETQSNMVDFYTDYVASLNETVTQIFRQERNLEIQTRVIEILELEVSEMSAFSASFLMPHPFGNKWKSKGRYLFYFDTIKLKLGGLIYLLGNR